MTPSLLLLVALGGAAGAVARYAISGGIQERAGGAFPWGTMTVNVVGCLLAGLVTGWLMGVVPPVGSGAPGGTPGGFAWALALAGFLGAFTTFSGFAADGVRLGGGGERRMAVLYLAGSLVLGVLAAGAGLLAGHLLP